MCDPNIFFPNEDWNPMTEEDTLVAPPMAAYAGAKTLAEKAVWKFADDHKHVDITVCKSFQRFHLSLVH
jgi:hypothetical protein